MFPSKKSLELCEKAHSLIPGGAHTYSKGDDQVSSNAPRFLLRGKGSRVWDLDGNEYVDWGMGLRSVILGHVYPEVVSAVKEAVDLGSNMCRPHPFEVELAELMNEVIPSAEMVKFAKNGSDGTTSAVKLARVHSGREKVAVCKEQPFFSVDDWFIGSTIMNAGIPKAIRDLTVKFGYNDLDSVKLLFEENPDEIACIFMEGTTGVPPKNNFLQKAIDIAHEHGALFVMDEVITGFRYGLGGVQAYFDVKPDLCIFGKAMANGFSVSAIAGRRDVMELGGIRHDKERVFLLSTTHGAELHGLAAAKAAINVMKEKDVSKKVWETGDKFMSEFNRISAENGMDKFIYMEGYGCSPIAMFVDEDGAPDFKLKTYVMQELFREGGVMFPGYFAPSFSHTDEDISKSVSVFDKAIKKAKEAKADGFEKHIQGDVIKPVFRKYN